MKRILLLLLLLLPATLHASNIDVTALEAAYPDARQIVLERHIDITYAENLATGNLSAFVTHREVVLALHGATSNMELVQVAFGENETVEIQHAAYYEVVDGKRQLLENVGVAAAEEKDYFQKSIFYSDLKVKQFAPTVDLPDCTILEYRFTKKYRDTKYLTSEYAQQFGEAVLDFTIALTVPSNVSAELIPFNTAVAAKESLSKGNTTYTYSLQNLKPVQRHGQSAPGNYVLPHFVVVTKSLTTNGKKSTLLATQADLYQWYQSLIDSMATGASNVRAQAAAIGANIESKEAQIDAVFSWLQANISYVAFEDGLAGFQPAPAEDVLDLRYGDCKGIANLAVEMLRKLGFKSYHCWVGTRRLNYDYSLPSLCVDNHMICALDFEGKTYYLDGTSRTTDWHTPPAHLQGKQALIGMGKAYRIDTIPIDPLGANVRHIDAQATINPTTGVLQLGGNINLSGQYALRERERLVHSDVATQKLAREYIAMDLMALDVATPTGYNVEPKGTSFKFPFKGDRVGNAVMAGNTLSLFCDVDRALKSRDGTQIETPVYINIVGTQSIELAVAIPAGYTASELPEPWSFEANQSNIKASISYRKEGNTIVYSKSISVGTTLLDGQQLTDWNTLVHDLTAHYSTPVILTKQ